MSTQFKNTLRKIAAGWFDNLNSAENLMNVHDSPYPPALHILGMYDRIREPYGKFEYEPTPAEHRKAFAQGYGRYMLSNRYQQDKRSMLHPRVINRATPLQPAASKPAGNKPAFTPEQRRSLAGSAALGVALGHMGPSIKSGTSSSK